MACEHNIDNHCTIATMLLATGDKVTVQKQACNSCMSNSNPKTVNEVTVGTAIATLMNLNKFNDQTHKHLIDSLNGIVGSVYNEGPGTNLKRYLSWFASEKPDCPCKDRSRVMNAWGPDLCEKNIEVILDWLESSAEKYKIPFVRFIAKLLVQKAIAESRNDR